jgi:short-subunit dehydrogenase
VQQSLQLRGFSFSLAEELKGTGVNLSLITPGSVITKMLDYEAQSDNSAISFLSKPISPEKVADAVLKVIQKPTLEKIIPRSVNRFGSKAAGFFSESFFYRLQIITQTWLVRKKKYLNRYCNFTLMKGVVR